MGVYRKKLHRLKRPASPLLEYAASAKHPVTHKESSSSLWKSSKLAKTREFLYSNTQSINHHQTWISLHSHFSDSVSLYPESPPWWKIPSICSSNRPPGSTTSFWAPCCRNLGGPLFLIFSRDGSGTTLVEAYCIWYLEFCGALTSTTWSAIFIFLKVAFLFLFFSGSVFWFFGFLFDFVLWIVFFLDIGVWLLGVFFVCGDVLVNWLVR